MPLSHFDQHCFRQFRDNDKQDLHGPCPQRTYVLLTIKEKNTRKYYLHTVINAVGEMTRYEKASKWKGPLKIGWSPTTVRNKTIGKDKPSFTSYLNKAYMCTDLKECLPYLPFLRGKIKML